MDSKVNSKNQNKAINLLNITNLSGGYGETLILNKVNLSLKSAQSIAIIGPNGAGKSTLMRAVFGMINITEGFVEFDGLSIASLKPNEIVKKGVSYVPQLANIFTEMSIQENLEMGGFLTKGDLTASFDYVYQLFPDLKKKSNQLAGVLSGGQRQMLAMGRALMLSPKLLLLDEPTAGLSPKYMKSIFSIIKNIQNQGVAIMIVEQHAKQVLGFVDNALVLVLGKNTYEGTGKELLDNKEVIKTFLGG